MAANDNNQKKSNSETIPFNISKMSTLQYIKIIYIGKDNELYEISTDVQIINNQTIQLYVNNQKDIDITCPTGIVLKLVTGDAIHFAKTILKEIKRINNKILFIMDAPKKTIRQQNRKHCRILLNCPCVLLVKDKKGINQTYLARSVNISMGGILVDNTESMLNDDKINLQLRKDDCCNIIPFIEQDFIIKLYAKFVRTEATNNAYRYAFQFIDMPQKYINPLNKYITNEQLKLLKAGNINFKNKTI